MQLFTRRRGRVRIASTLTAAVALLALLPGVAQAAPPSNDHFADAAPITTVPAAAETELSEATVEPGEPDPSCSHYSAAPSAWFAFTAPRTEWITLNETGADYSAILAVYTGESLGGLTEVFCTVYDRSVLAVTAGQTYRIQVSNRFPESFPTEFALAVAPPLKTQIYRTVFDPSILDTITFGHSPFDNLGSGFTRQDWDFGDGATASGREVTHRFTTDGDYVVRVDITAEDGRTATATLPIAVRTHDVRIAAFTVPTAGRTGQTKPIEVSVGNQRIPEHATVILYRANSAGFEEIARATQYVPARPNRTVTFPFNYTFAPEDAAVGRITFRAEVTLGEYTRDARTVDNEAVAPATTVRPAANGVS